jgi:hypothetical protein
MAEAVTVLYFLQGEHGESEHTPNAFVVRHSVCRAFVVVPLVCADGVLFWRARMLLV